MIGSPIRRGNASDSCIIGRRFMHNSSDGCSLAFIWLIISLDFLHHGLRKTKDSDCRRGCPPKRGGDQSDRSVANFGTELSVRILRLQLQERCDRCWHHVASFHSRRRWDCSCSCSLFCAARFPIPLDSIGRVCSLVVVGLRRLPRFEWRGRSIVFVLRAPETCEPFDGPDIAVGKSSGCLPCGTEFSAGESEPLHCS